MIKRAREGDRERERERETERERHRDNTQKANKHIVVPGASAMQRCWEGDVSMLVEAPSSFIILLYNCSTFCFHIVKARSCQPDCACVVALAVYIVMIRSVHAI